jgi:hypothetical protein
MQCPKSVVPEKSFTARLLALMAVAAAMGGCAGAPGTTPSGGGSNGPHAATPPPRDVATSYALTSRDESPSPGEGRPMIDAFGQALGGTWTALSGSPRRSDGLLRFMSENSLTRVVTVTLTVRMGTISDGEMQPTTMSAVAECVYPERGGDARAARTVNGTRATTDAEFRQAARDLAADLVRAVNSKFQPFSADELRGQVAAVEATPARQALTEARQLADRGDLRGALTKLAEATRLAPQANAASTVDEIATYRATVVDRLATELLTATRSQDDKQAVLAAVEVVRLAPAGRQSEVDAARAGVIDRGLRALRAALDQNKLDDARPIHAALDAIVGDRRAELQPLAARVMEASRQAAAQLLQQAAALPRGQHQQAQRLLDDAMRLLRARLGANCSPNTQGPGEVVNSVSAGSVGAFAGLCAGDVILSIGGERITENARVSSVVQRARGRVEIAIERAGAPRVLVAEFGVDEATRQQADQLMRTNAQAREELTPTYIGNVRVRKDGAGLVVEFGLKNRGEQFTAAEGRARIRLVVCPNSTREVVVMELYDRAHDLQVDAFRRTATTPLGVQLPRIAYEDVDQPLGAMGSAGFRQYLIENQLEVVAIVEFTATGAREPIQTMEPINPFTF